MRLNKDFLEFIESHNANEIKYLIVGAFAVAWHGYARFTVDIDFFVRPTPKNADAVLARIRMIKVQSALVCGRRDLNPGHPACEARRIYSSVNHCNSRRNSPETSSPSVRAKALRRLNFYLTITS